MEVDRSCESGLWNVVGGFIARPLNRPLNPPLNIDSDLDRHYQTRDKNLTLQSIDRVNPILKMFLIGGACCALPLAQTVKPCKIVAHHFSADKLQADTLYFTLQVVNKTPFFGEFSGCFKFSRIFPAL